MKLLSVIVFLALLIGPLFLSVFYHICKSFVDKTETSRPENKPLPTPDRAKYIRLRNYSILSVYIVLFIASGIWMAYELFRDYFQIKTSLDIVLAILCILYVVLLFGPIVGWGIFSYKKSLKKYPMPINYKDYSEWENDYRKYSRNLGFGWKRNLIIFAGYFIAITLLFCVSVYFLATK